MRRLFANTYPPNDKFIRSPCSERLAGRERYEEAEWKLNGTWISMNRLCWNNTGPEGAKERKALRFGTFMKP